MHGSPGCNFSLTCGLTYIQYRSLRLQSILFSQQPESARLIDNREIVELGWLCECCSQISSHLSFTARCRLRNLLHSCSGSFVKIWRKSARMTTHVSALYGVGLSGLVVFLLVAFVFLVRYRRSLNRNLSKSKSSDLHLSPITPTVTVKELRTIGQQRRADIPPDYESVMKSSNTAHHVSLPPPTPDQMGTFTTHYVTTPSQYTPPPENTVLYLSGPLSELH